LIFLSDVRTYFDVYIHLVKIILMYSVLSLMHMLNILDKFSMSVTFSITNIKPLWRFFAWHSHPSDWGTHPPT